MKQVMKCILILSLVICMIPMHKVNALEESFSKDMYISDRELLQEEMAEIFLDGYKKIVCYSDDNARSSGTYSETICTSMKKRPYDWIAYSKSCFYETYTAVTFVSDSISFSCSIGGVGISVPVTTAINAVNTSISISLTESEKELLDEGYYSCIRFKGYLTWCRYMTKTYDRATNQLLSTTSFNHTYAFKSNETSGFDYYHEVRTPTQLTEIRKNNYVGTNIEKTDINDIMWTTITNPGDASILP